MGGVICTLSGGGRYNLSILAICLHLLLVLSGQLLVLAALYIRFVVEVRVAVVIGGHGGALTYFLTVLGCILCIFYTASAKVTYDASSEDSARRRTCRLLVFLQFCQMFSMLLVVVANIMVIVHKWLITDTLHQNFINAIGLYRVERHVKTAIDVIQISFQCCGAAAANDWFKNAWVPVDYINVDHPAVQKYIKNGEFIKDDAPFSCCDPYVTKPCLHHDLETKEAHSAIMGFTTLYSTGCINKLDEYWRTNVLNPAAWVLFIIFLLQFLAGFFCRLLQTSLDGALDTGDNMAPGDSYLCAKALCSILPNNDPTTILQRQQALDEERKLKEQREKEADALMEASTTDEEGGTTTESETQNDDDETDGEDSSDGGGGGGKGGDSKDKKDKKRGKKKGGKQKKKKGDIKKKKKTKQKKPKAKRMKMRPKGRMFKGKGR